MKRMEDLNEIEKTLVINEKLSELEIGIKRGLLDYGEWKRIVDMSYDFLKQDGKTKFISNRFQRLSNKVTEIMREEYSNFIILDN